MNEQARDLLIVMLRDCGTDIVRMQASFDMYLAQYLADFPEERQLLRDAFKVGIPEKILQHAGEPEYGKYLVKLGPRFAEVAQRHEDECAWAVETWALALRRTADFAPAPKLPDRLYPEHFIAPDSPELKWMARGSMAFIVTVGGALGGALGSTLVPMVFFGMSFGDELRPAGRTTAMHSISTEWEQIGLFVILGAIAAGIGGSAALAGWVFGKGAEFPWATFSVAIGASFTMTLICLFALPAFVQPVVLFGSVFAATFRSAARGGNY